MESILKILLLMVIIYVSFILHEVGHCFWPKLAGCNTLNKIVIGIGHEKFHYKFLGIKFIITSIPIPFGRFGSCDKIFTVEELTFFQRTLVHLGGIITNLLIAISTALVLHGINTNLSDLSLYELFIYIFKNVFNIVANGLNPFLYDIFRDNNIGFLQQSIFLVATINAIIFLMNAVPIPIAINHNKKIIFNDGGQFFHFILKRIVLLER